MRFVHDTSNLIDDFRVIGSQVSLLAKVLVEVKHLQFSDLVIMLPLAFFRVIDCFPLPHAHSLVRLRLTMLPVEVRVLLLVLCGVEKITAEKEQESRLPSGHDYAHLRDLVPFHVVPVSADARRNPHLVAA